MAKTKQKTPKKIKDNPLTEQQKLFAEEFAKDFKKRDAAIRAGYAEKSAHVAANRLLNNDKILELVNRYVNERKKKNELNFQYVIDKIMETIERCSELQPITDFFGNKIIIEVGEGEDKKELAAVCGFDAKNVLKGCELLGKHLAMFTENINSRIVDKEGNDVDEITIRVLRPPADVDRHRNN